MNINHIKETVGEVLEAVNYVGQSLEEAKKHGLETEVVTWAIVAALKNPELSVKDCIQAGLDEWVK